MECLPGLDASTTATPRAVAPPAPLTIVLHTPRNVRAWVGSLATRLGQGRHTIRMQAAATDPLPVGVDWLLYFERLSRRGGGNSFGPSLAPITDTAVAADLVIDLAGNAPETDVPTLHLLFAGGAGETGLVEALLAMEPPQLTLAVTQRGVPQRILRRACLAVERPLDLGPALDSLTARLSTLIVDAVARLPDAEAADNTRPAPTQAPTPTQNFAAAALSHKIWQRVDRLVRRVDCWRIATRIVPDGHGVLETLAWGDAPWRLLPDDGKRYFADPVLFAHAGQRWLLCEEYPHATDKGILSVAAVADDGVVGAPKPFLETAGHLSWPQVFVHAGQIYMVPETVAAGRVELWRAVDFPHRWELDRVLIPNVRAHDPVLHLTETGAFLLASVDADGGSSWDALALFSAPDLFGPWQAHPHNPLLVDAGSARAAGPLVHRNGELWRATQDCRAGYGAGMALCRVTRLDHDGFAQEVVARLAPPPGSEALGAHTLSRLGSLEAIDVRAPVRGFGRA